jgi:hypothetical protein
MSCNGKNKDDCCFSCCCDKEFVQDKLCCEFRLTTETLTQIYTANSTGTCGGIFASGAIKNCGPTPLVVQFLRGVNATGSDGTLVRTLSIPSGGCGTFTVSGFDVIQVIATGATPDNPGIGELCITPRYRIG